MGLFSASSEEQNVRTIRRLLLEKDQYVQLIKEGRGDLNLYLNHLRVCEEQLDRAFQERDQIKRVYYSHG